MIGPPPRLHRFPRHALPGSRHEPTSSLTQREVEEPFKIVRQLREPGWHNYSLFVREDGTLFGYFETPESLEAAQGKIAGREVNTRRQESMAPYFESPSNARPDEMFVEPTEVYHLD